MEKKLRPGNRDGILLLPEPDFKTGHSAHRVAGALLYYQKPRPDWRKSALSSLSIVIVQHPSKLFLTLDAAHFWE